LEDLFRGSGTPAFATVEEEVVAVPALSGATTVGIEVKATGSILHETAVLTGIVFYVGQVIRGKGVGIEIDVLVVIGKESWLPLLFPANSREVRKGLLFIEASDHLGKTFLTLTYENDIH
jgi:hypothetical protein